MNKQRLDFLNGVQELISTIFGLDKFEIQDYKEYLSITIWPKEDRQEIKGAEK